MWKSIRPLLPHAAIILADAYIVFFLIDRFNTAMNFIDNRLTKGLLLIMCLLTIANRYIFKKRRRPVQKKAAKKHPVRRDGT